MFRLFSKRRSIRKRDMKTYASFAFAVFNDNTVAISTTETNHIEWLGKEYNISKDEVDNMILGYVTSSCTVIIYKTSKRNPLAAGELKRIIESISIHILQICGSGNYDIINGSENDNTYNIKSFPKSIDIHGSFNRHYTNIVVEYNY